MIHRCAKKVYTSSRVLKARAATLCFFDINVRAIIARLTIGIVSQTLPGGKGTRNGLGGSEGDGALYVRAHDYLRRDYYLYLIRCILKLHIRSA